MRFQDSNITLHHFQNEIFVECPKCSRRATVTKDEPNNFYSERTLKCRNCFHSKTGRKQSFAIELNCYCSNCSSPIKLDMPNVNEKKETIALKCSNCGVTENYAPRNIVQDFIYQNTGKPSESYFGLPLWLNQNYRGNNFWAFNYEHLDYLKAYISADLREKNGRTHWTLVEKLPDWIKSAKNREKLVKLITELERK